MAAAPYVGILRPPVTYAPALAWRRPVLMVAPLLAVMTVAEVNVAPESTVNAPPEMETPWLECNPDPATVIPALAEMDCWMLTGEATLAEMTKEPPLTVRPLAAVKSAPVTEIPFWAWIR